MPLNALRARGAVPSRNTSDQRTEEFGDREQLLLEHYVRRSHRPSSRRLPSHPLPPFVCGGVVECSSEGLTNISPANAARIAGARSEWADCFRTNPTAPTAKASAISWECVCMLQMMILHSGRSRRRNRAASRPPTSGIMISNTTTSGWRRSASFTAAPPSGTAPTTSPTVSANRQRFVRICGWSSANRMCGLFTRPHSSTMKTATTPHSGTHSGVTSRYIVARPLVTSKSSRSSAFSLPTHRSNF